MQTTVNNRTDVLSLISHFGDVPRLDKFRAIGSAFIFEARISKRKAQRILRQALADAKWFVEENDFEVSSDAHWLTGEWTWQYYETACTGAEVYNLHDVYVEKGKVVYATWDFGYFVEVRSDGTVKFTIDPEATDFDAN
jgi:hypothetical protein